MMVSAKMGMLKNKEINFLHITFHYIINIMKLLCTHVEHDEPLVLLILMILVNGM